MLLYINLWRKDDNIIFEIIKTPQLRPFNISA